MKIFKPFGKIEHVDCYNPNGAGLGLSFCKSLCKMLSGDIKVSSNGYQGSTFKFYINVSLAPDAYLK